MVVTLCEGVMKNMTVREDLLRYVADAREETAVAVSVTEVDNVRVKYLGKKGLISTMLRRMGEVPAEERPLIGKFANDARTEVEDLVGARLKMLEREEDEASLLAEKVDVTLPGRIQPRGRLHLLQKVYDEIERIFLGMGFEIGRAHV